MRINASGVVGSPRPPARPGPILRVVPIDDDVSEQPPPSSALAALELLDAGFHPVALHPGEKRPIGVGWGLERPDAEFIRDVYRQNPGAGVGVCLGPGKAPGGRWLVDVEGDGPEAESSFLALVGGELIETASWTSARGRHRLFVVGGGFSELLKAAGAVEGKGGASGALKLAALPDLEFRIGGAKPDGTLKQLQSACPPTPGTDGKAREWIGGRKVAELPDAALVCLEAIGERRAIQAEARPIKPPGRTTEADAVERYVRAAVDAELAAVAGAAEGTRNVALNRAAFSIGTLVGAGEVPETEAAESLAAAGRAAGLGGAEIRATIRSGLEAGKLQPRDLSGVGAKRRAVEAGQVDGDVERAGEGFPEIEVTADELDVSSKAIAALAGDPGLYQMGYGLVTVLEHGEGARGVEYQGGTPPQIRRLGLPTLRERIASRARFVRTLKTNGERVRVHVPDWCVKAVEARGVYPGVRPLEGVIQAPTMRPDGSILDRPGYDPATRLYYSPNAAFNPIPEFPTRAEAEAARDMLLDVVADFPLQDEADRAVWLTSLLTVLARPSFSGPAPLFGFDANSPGAGKGMLCDAVAMVATGRKMPRTVWPGGAYAGEEVRKRITSIALAGDRLALLDNVDEPLGGAALDAALTSTTWKDRTLGRSEMTAELPLNTVWFSSGNNLSCRGDLIRRVLFARLETPLERPEERTGFRHPDLLEYILGDRPRLVAAALTILRAYHVAGRPDVGVKPLGSFEGWTRAIARPVAWITGVSPLDVRDRTRTADPEANRLVALILGFAELPFAESGATSAAIIRLLEDPANAELFGTLRNVLLELSPTGGLPSPRALSQHLSPLNGRVIQGFMLRSVSYKGTSTWKIVRT